MQIGFERCAHQYFRECVVRFYVQMKSLLQNNSTIRIIECPKKWIVVAERPNDFVSQLGHNYLMKSSNSQISMMWCEKSPPDLLKTLMELIFEPKMITPDVSMFVDEFSDADDVAGQGEVFWKAVRHFIDEGKNKWEDVLKEFDGAK